MSFRSACIGVGLAAACSLSLGGQTPPAAITLLERYAAGQFDAVTAELGGIDDFGQLLKDLKNYAGEWIAAGGPADVSRRELAAATFALEAARVDEWWEWKWIQEPPPGTTPLPTLYWKPPPLLIEWACELFRRDDAPRPIERTWQLAAMAVAQRSEDTQFLIGFTELLGGGPAPAAAPVNLPHVPIRNLRIGPMRRGIEVANVQDEIGHLNHIVDRFPTEMRFMLGQGIARERDFPEDAAKIYTGLADDPDVGAEALTRLGGLQVRQNRVADALPSLDRAERLTRDSYLLYLTRLFRGQALLRTKKEAAAEAAFRGALAARPAMETASLLLAELLFKAGNRTEAQSLMARVLAADPSVRDPYLEAVHGDDRFWPALVARLRREIKP
jgi:tetratricopeptide (TPR) repeat protein